MTREQSLLACKDYWAAPADKASKFLASRDGAQRDRNRARTSRSCVWQEFVYSSRGSVIRSIHTLGSVQRLRVAVHSSRGTFVDVGNDVAGGSKVEVFSEAMSLREPNLCAYTHVNSAPSKKIWAE